MRDRVLHFFNTTSDHYHVVFTSGATQALHIVGEIFPWSKDSEFVYLSEVRAVFILPAESQFCCWDSRICKSKG